MKTQNMLLALGTVLLFGTAGAFAQTTSGSSAATTSSTSVTSTGMTSSGSTSATASTTATSSAGGSAGQTSATTGAANAGLHAQASTHEHVANPNASAYAAAVQTVLAKYDATRDQYITQRQTLIAQLQAATTDTQRQAIIAQMKADLQAEASARVQMAKEIRGDLKALRLQRQNGGS